MSEVDIQVECIAHSKVNKDAVRRWLDRLGVSDEYELPDSDSDPALLVALAAKRCYNSFEPGLNPNVTRVRKDLADYLDNILKSGHGSVLEHATYTFAIEGLTRVATAELNRHRAGVAVSEASMRYIRFDEDIPYWMPLCIQVEDPQEKDANVVSDYPVLCDSQGRLRAKEEIASYSRHLNENEKKELSRVIFRSAFESARKHYNALEGIWAEELAPGSGFHGKKTITSMMRRIIGMGVSTGGVWTFNLRSLRHVIALRSTPGAEEEIAYIVGLMAKTIAELEPDIFGDFSQDENGFWVPKYNKV